MENKTEEINSGAGLENLPVQSANPAFQPDEMVSCEKCERSNPPTRLKCLYCGEQLVISEAQAANIKPNFRKPENWEKGFNLIFLPNTKVVENSKLAEIASMVTMEAGFLEEIISSRNSLPLARLETKDEAEIVQKHLLNFGIETKVLNDADLKIEKPVRRLRGMDFWDDKLVLILFNADEISEIVWENLNLIVTGAIFERRVKATEERDKKGENKLLETNETATDEILLDIYSRQDEIGYRIEQKGFDFSCLGAEKSLLAAENIRRLVKTLSARAKNVKVVDNYLQIRPLLADVWQVDERKNSQGMKRARFGKFSLENITTVNNLAQFTKYSRLQHHLL